MENIVDKIKEVEKLVCENFEYLVTEIIDDTLSNITFDME